MLLLAQPRLAGFLFDPVSFWLCVDGEGALRAVIAEVNNIFGDRHSYLCVHADGRPIRPEDEMTAAKVFHVSPFQDIAGGYTFRFRLSERLCEDFRTKKIKKRVKREVWQGIQKRIRQEKK